MANCYFRALADIHIEIDIRGVLFRWGLNKLYIGKMITLFFIECFDASTRILQFPRANEFVVARMKCFFDLGSLYLFVTIDSNLTETRKFFYFDDEKYTKRTIGLYSK